MAELLERILTAPLVERTDIDPGAATWVTGYRSPMAPLRRPIERAIAGGFAAPALGYAFAAGYLEAVCALVPDDIVPSVAVLSATEAGGAHPRAIRARLSRDGDGFRLGGAKRWATLAPVASELVVIASVGMDESGRNRLAAVYLPTEREGITITAMPPTPFVPEIPHGEITFDAVRVEASERLPGDGYTDYLKPFRTIEDVHVFAAVLAWLLQVARAASWPPDASAELCALLSCCRDLAERPPSSPATHLALAGLLAQARFLFDRLEPLWERADAATRAGWQRDRALLSVAEKARERRLASAIERLAVGD